MREPAVPQRPLRRKGHAENVAVQQRFIALPQSHGILGQTLQPRDTFLYLSRSKNSRVDLLLHDRVRVIR